jgi:hypothetical protein
MFGGYRSNVRQINLWVIAGAIGVAAILAVSLLLLLNATKADTQAYSPATAVLNVIDVPDPTNTPQIFTPVPTFTQSADVPPAPPPGEISVGASVQISGTGGDGLRLRSNPGLQGDVLYLGYEGEVFQISDGPDEVDGYTWWHLSAPYDEKVHGWAVSNFLTILQNP